MALTYMSQLRPNVGFLRRSVAAPRRRIRKLGVRIIKHREQQSRPAKKACQLQTGIGALSRRGFIKPPGPIAATIISRFNCQFDAL